MYALYGNCGLCGAYQGRRALQRGLHHHWKTEHSKEKSPVCGIRSLCWLEEGASSQSNARGGQAGGKEWTHARKSALSSLLLGGRNRKISRWQVGLKILSHSLIVGLEEEEGKQPLILLRFCLFVWFHYSDLPPCICLVSGPTQCSKAQHLEGLVSSLGSHARMCILVSWTCWKYCAHWFRDSGHPALLAFSVCLQFVLFAWLCN